MGKEVDPHTDPYLSMDTGKDNVILPYYKYVFLTFLLIFVLWKHFYRAKNDL